MSAISPQSQPLLADHFAVTPVLPATSTVYRQLAVRQKLCILLSICLGVAAFFTHHTYRHVIATISNDAAPSIIAAAQISSDIAHAHTLIANLFLSKEGTESPLGQAYISAIDQADDHLLFAAQNITFGNEERRSVLAAMTQMSEYERLVGMAFVSKEPVRFVLKADTLMREKLLPSVSLIDEINVKHLTASYTDEVRQATYYFYTSLLFAALMLVLFLETQVKLYRECKRIFNLPMLLGTISLLSGIALMSWHVSSLTRHLQIAKVDAFDSIHSLSHAKANAYVANAQESLYLLVTDKTVQSQQAAFFMSYAHQLFDGNIGIASALIANPSSVKTHGLLGDELANIAFAGEHEAAAESLTTWAESMAIDAHVRQLESAGEHQKAIALGTGKHEHESDWAFERFTTALAKALSVNQQAFEAAIGRCVGILQWTTYLLLLLFLAPLIGSYVGIRQRLLEYR